MILKKLLRLTLFATLSAATTASAQAPAGGEVKNDDIVVRGERSTDEPDLTNARPMVIVGSRIPHKSLQNNPYIASATSLGGLTPDSGMDAFERIQIKHWQTCKVDGAALRKPIACRLARVQLALKGGKPLLAEQLALPLLTRADLSTEERYVVQEYLFRIAEAIPDTARKRQALAGMVDTGAMPAARERLALLTLASMSVSSRDFEDAVRRYLAAAALDPDDTQSRINAAALLQNLGRPDEGKAQVRAAIAIAQRSNQPVPSSWVDNAR